MKAIKLDAVIDERYELHLKLPEGVKTGPAEVIVMFEDDGDAAEDTQKSLEIEATKGLRQFGQFRGTLQIADDFDEPLPDAFWLEKIDAATAIYAYFSLVDGAQDLQGSCPGRLQ